MEKKYKEKVTETLQQLEQNGGKVSALHNCSARVISEMVMVLDE